ncbi:MAG: bifunctional phosphoribosyl-AMP cyclohydrolase/phosphoribosyl-ATP diphosphatase HisIE [Deltaproteobacteria bacterium]|nr:bifunctional phosphoribosyl-AMP cyclohydrolase/phosphoribosyl-ATP diphosphatase HisIE [Deltaproteobacteria bacterium]
MDIAQVKFDGAGLIPAIAQDADTLEVLMLAYMNSEALEKTLSTGRAHYFSRSRNKLWLKGETSGNFLSVKEVYYDCDADAVLLKCAPMGPACHTGERSCFFRRLDEDGQGRANAGVGVIRELFQTIKDRKGASPETSYVAGLLTKGRQKILEKIIEESGELVKAATEETRKHVIHETVDLWFHTLVLLASEGIEADELFKEFGRRRGTSGLEEKASRGAKGGV